MSEFAQKPGVLGKVREKEFVDGLHSGFELPYPSAGEPVATKGIQTERKECRNGFVPRTEHLVAKSLGFADEAGMLGVVVGKRRGSGEVSRRNGRSGELLAGHGHGHGGGVEVGTRRCVDCSINSTFGHRTPSGTRRDHARRRNELYAKKEADTYGVELCRQCTSDRGRRRPLRYNTANDVRCCSGRDARCPKVFGTPANAGRCLWRKQWLQTWMLK